MSSDFKKSVLDALGINFKINANKFKELIEISKSNLGNDSGEKDKLGNLYKYYLGDGETSNVENVARNVSKFIDTVLKVDKSSKTRKANYEAAQRKRKAWENDLKTFSLNDLLSNSKGFEIGKGVALSNSEGYMMRNNDETNYKRKNLNAGSNTSASLTYKDISSTNVFLINNDVKNNNDPLLKILGEAEFPRGTFLILSKNKLESQKYPASFMEQIISKFYGGKLADSVNQAVWDIDNGTYLSIKCVSKTKNIDYGSFNSLMNFDYKNKHLMLRTYNYDCKEIKDVKDVKDLIEVLELKKGKLRNIKEGIEVYICKPNSKYTGEFKQLFKKDDKDKTETGIYLNDKTKVVAGESGKNSKDVIDIFNKFNNDSEADKKNTIKSLIEKSSISIGNNSKKIPVYDSSLNKIGDDGGAEQIKMAIIKDIDFLTDPEEGKVGKTRALSQVGKNILDIYKDATKNVTDQNEINKIQKDILNSYKKSKKAAAISKTANAFKTDAQEKVLTDNNVYLTYTAPAIKLVKGVVNIPTKNKNLTCYFINKKDSLRYSLEANKIFSQLVASLLVRDKFKYGKELKIEVPKKNANLCFVWLDAAKTEWALAEKVAINGKKNAPKDTLNNAVSKDISKDISKDASKDTPKDSVEDEIKEMFNYKDPYLFNY